MTKTLGSLYEAAASAVEAAGFTVNHAMGWETDDTAYACSDKWAGRGPYSVPAKEVTLRR